ncbi:HMCN1-like protein, partial [Mya arenaria]
MLLSLVPGGWTNWGDFGQCINIAYDSTTITMTCSHHVTKTLSIILSSKTDGIWETWAEWGSCSATCGTSVRFRFRNCTFSTRNGTCTGNEYESDLCSNPCPVNGSWSDWSSWARCSVTCEHGTTHRERLCANPPALHGGLPCAGDNEQTKNCTVPTPCPVNGMWSEWTVWSSCDATCDDGHRLRIRRCSHPPPMYHGKPCVGKDIETGACNDGHCKIDGGWTQWFEWGACSTTCGSGSTSRFRVCSNPKPEYGGDFCDGEFEEFSNCSINPDVTNCTIDGGWGSWEQWSSCGVTCGDGNGTRTRACDNPSPHGEGKYCVGNGSDVQSCTNPTPCPVNGGWATWHAWFACTSTCGNGTQTRFRTCTHPKPANGGNYCVGNNDDTKGCTGPDCAGEQSSVNILIRRLLLGNQFSCSITLMWRL